MTQETALDTIEDDDDTVLRIGGQERRDRTGDYRQFVITDADDEPLTPVLTAKRPKMATLARIAVGVNADDEAEAMRAYDTFIDAVLTPESAQVVRDLMEDDDEELDLDHMREPVQALVGLWYGRPTGSSGASSTRSSTPRGGKRSKGKRR